MKRSARLAIVILSISLVFPQPNFIYGQNDAAENAEVKQLNTDIQSKRDSIKKIQEQQAVYERIIREKQGEKASLNNQLAILDNRLAKSQLDIESAETDIERTKLEIKKVNLAIVEKDQDIERQKQQIAAVLRLLQKQDQKSYLEIMLLNDSLTDFVNQVKYLEDVNSKIGDSLDMLKELKGELESEKAALAEKSQELENYKNDLEDKKTALLSDQENKSFILDQTNQSEREYQRLLKQAKDEQERAAADIVSLEKIVRDKLAKISGNKLEFTDAGLIWPVKKNTITAYFHDPDYPFRYIFEHPAVDIRAAQGTPLKAAASGYVARAKDGGKGYSYVMLVHGNGLSTVYGHVSKILVSEDEYVVQGQTIALSGGLPGTPGAGRLTTGAHLHFEVRLNGIPVNPLEYLP